MPTVMVFFLLKKKENAMFPRIKSYRNKDGSWRHYLYLVATKRIGGRDNLYACIEPADGTEE